MRAKGINYDTGFINPDMAWEPKVAFSTLAQFYRFS